MDSSNPSVSALSDGLDSDSSDLCRRDSAKKPFTRAEINVQAPADDPSRIRSLPELIEFDAQHNPDHVFCLQARKGAGGSSPDFREITFWQLKQAVHLCSEWLKTHIMELALPSKEADGRIKKGPPVALLMDSEITLLVYQYALLGLGVPVCSAPDL